MTDYLREHLQVVRRGITATVGRRADGNDALDGYAAFSWTEPVLAAESGPAQLTYCFFVLGQHYVERLADTAFVGSTRRSSKAADISHNEFQEAADAGVGAPACSHDPGAVVELELVRDRSA